MDLTGLTHQCASAVEPRIMLAVARVESGLNPFAIGVVNGRLERQPRNLDEAVATARALERDGWNFSVGVAQVNRYNLPKYRLDYTAAFDACSNLRAGAGILKDCHDRARRLAANDQAAWQMAYSCYYSGNFRTGFKADFKGQPSYVNKVLASTGNAEAAGLTIPVRRTGTQKRVQAAQVAGSEPVGEAWAVYGAKEI